MPRPGYVLTTCSCTVGPPGRIPSLNADGRRRRTDNKCSRSTTTSLRAVPLATLVFWRAFSRMAASMAAAETMAQIIWPHGHQPAWICPSDVLAVFVVSVLLLIVE